jgi:hypothetical protein
MELVRRILGSFFFSFTKSGGPQKPAIFISSAGFYDEKNKKIAS